MLNKFTVFLDFDGVLFDSVLEAYLLSRFAYFDIPFFEPVKKQEYEIFHKVRFLVVNSWNYYYIMRLIESNVFETLADFKKKYLTFVNKREIKKEKEFDIKFQNARKFLIENHYEFWSKLDKPYNFLKKIKRLSKKLKIYIISTKNKTAIVNKLKDYDFIININKKNIIDKKTLKKYSSKGEFLSKFMIKNKINDAIFIDDNEENIKSCKNIKNLDCYLAAWGYVDPKTDGLSEDKIIDYIKGKICR